MKYLTAYLLWASMLVCEAHTAFTGMGSVTVGGHEMRVQYYVWFLCNSLWAVMLAASAVVYRPNLVNWTSVRVYLFYCIADLGMFLYNYKQDGYKIIYTLVMVAWVITFNYGRRRCKDRQGIITAR